MANYFAKADLCKEDKIKADHLILMFEANDIKLDDDELETIAAITDEDGKISRVKYWEFIRKCRHWEDKLAAVGKSKIYHETVFLDRRLKIEGVLRDLKFEDKEEKARSAKMSKSEKMDEIFRMFDKDRDGKISREEFEDIKKHLTKDQLESVQRSLEKSEDGKLGRQEFEEALKKKKR